MNFQQLRIVHETVRRNFNLTEVAAALFTSQSGVSKHIKDLEDELGPTDCIHGQKGCTTCTRACPRFRTWEAEADEHLFARTREPDEMSGIYQDVLLTRASDDYGAGNR